MDPWPQPHAARDLFAWNAMPSSFHWLSTCAAFADSGGMASADGLAQRLVDSASNDWLKGDRPAMVMHQNLPGVLHAERLLIKGDLRGIVMARTLSEATVANMKQNLAFAFVHNAIGVPLAAGVLYASTGWLLSPMFAALAMSLSSVSVITNALCLRSKDLRAP